MITYEFTSVARFTEKVALVLGQVCRFEEFLAQT